MDNIRNESKFLDVGTLLTGRYVIQGVIGSGGFGITYKAYDKLMEQTVCIKEYYPSGIVNRQVDTNALNLSTENYRVEFIKGKGRFLEEAKELVKFKDADNIVSVQNFFEENSTAYMVMEYLEGCTLGQFTKRKGGILDLNSALYIMDKVMCAMETIHNAGVIHRDISPDNIIILTDSNIKLIDFGAAKQAYCGETQNLSVMLKPGYAPAEQYSNNSHQGSWTDIYAFGATMYRMLTGKRPEESVSRMLQDNLIHPKTINENIPDYLNYAIMKAMAVKPEERFQTIAEFRKAVFCANDGLENSENISGVKIKKKTGIIALVASLALVTVCGGTYFVVKSFDNKNASKEQIQNESVEEDSANNEVSSTEGVISDNAEEVKENNSEENNDINDNDVTTEEDNSNDNAVAEIIDKYAAYCELGQYKGLEYAMSSYEVTDDDVKEQVNQLLLECSNEEKILTGTVQNGDKINIDFVGYVDGEEFEGGSTMGAGYDLILGSGNFIPGFEEGIEGHEIGENFDINVTFTDDYTDSLKGKDAVFNITINYKINITLPEYNDEFVATHTNYSNVSEYENEIKINLENSNLEKSNLENRQAVISAVEENSKIISYPEQDMEQLVAQAIESVEAEAISYQVDYETYIKNYYGMESEKAFEDYVKSLAESYLAEKILICAIAKEEGIVVTSEEVLGCKETMMSDVGIDNEEDFNNRYTEDDVKYYTLSDKGYKFLLENNKGIN